MRSVAIIIINNNKEHAWRKFCQTPGEVLERAIKQVISWGAKENGDDLKGNAA